MTDTDQTNDVRQDYKQGARNRKVFTSSHLIFGLPSNVFLGGCALAVGVFFISTWYWGVLLAAIYFPPMFSIHKDDPRALAVWKTTLSDRTAGWQAGVVTRRSLVVLSDSD
jgi:hypothetical protein